MIPIKPPPVGELAAIFTDICVANDPRFDLSTPWREGQDVYATDGAIVVRIGADALAREVLNGIPAWTRRQPRGVASELQRLGPFRADPTPLPVLDLDAPPCVDCGGRGALPRSGKAVAVAPGYWLDRWYVTLLRLHGANLYLPRPTKRYKSCALKFVIGPAVGFVMTWATSQLSRGMRNQYRARQASR